MPSDWTFPEDLRRAPHGEENVCATGEKFWVLRVTLYQSPAWPVDCVTRLLIWEGLDGRLWMEHGKYWPAVEQDEDDGA